PAIATRREPRATDSARRSPFGRAIHRSGVFREDPPFNPNRGPYPGGLPFCEFVGTELDVHGLRVAVDGNHVAILEKRDWAANPRLGGHGADHGAVGAAGESAISAQADALAEALTDRGARDREHLAHSGPADRALAADDDDVPGFDLAGLDRL